MNSFRVLLSHSSVFHSVVLPTHPPRSVSPIPEAQITGRLLGQPPEPTAPSRAAMDPPCWPIPPHGRTARRQLSHLPPQAASCSSSSSLPGPSHSYSSCSAFCSSACLITWAPVFPGTSRMIILKSSEIVTPVLNYTGWMEAALHGRISASSCSGSAGGWSFCHPSLSAPPPGFAGLTLCLQGASLFSTCKAHFVLGSLWDAFPSSPGVGCLRTPLRIELSKGVLNPRPGEARSSVC